MSLVGSKSCPSQHSANHPKEPGGVRTTSNRKKRNLPFRINVKQLLSIDQVIKENIWFSDQSGQPCWSRTFQYFPKYGLSSFLSSWNKRNTKPNAEILLSSLFWNLEPEVSRCFQLAWLVHQTPGAPAVSREVTAESALVLQQTSWLCVLYGLLSVTLFRPKSPWPQR